MDKGAGMSGQVGIPNVFHFVFGLREQTEPFHLMHYLCLRSCLEVMRPDAVHFHYQHEPHGPLWDAIRPHLQLRRIDPRTPAAGHTYSDPAMEAFRYAHAADFLRVEILLREGGVYADMDSLFLRPFPADWRAYPCVMGHERPPRGAEGSLCNALILAQPGAEFCRLWLEQMDAAFDDSWSNHSTLLPYRLSQAHPELIHVEPEASFFALDWTPEGIGDLFLRDAALPEQARSLHLWAHLWFDAGREDFSVFSGDLLTIDYLAFSRSSYARLARGFMPPGARPSRLRHALQTARLRVRQLRNDLLSAPVKAVRSALGRALRSVFPRP